MCDCRAYDALGESTIGLDFEYLGHATTVPSNDDGALSKVDPWQLRNRTGNNSFKRS